MNCSRFFLTLSICVAIPNGAQAESYVTDKPSPLRLANPKKAQLPTLEFKGSVLISGKFLITRETYDQTNYHLRIFMYPDEKSAALLPRLTQRDGVKELGITNWEKTAAILFGPDAVRMLLSGELPSATIEAAVTINEYLVVVQCDQKFYLAELVSVAKMQEMVVAGRQDIRIGCG